ncbi:MAG: hypothetical protein IJS14_06860 [Lentisphaeria bacterium]|nr:hypothetical protein [Lentisphaeria bacterium]
MKIIAVDIGTSRIKTALFDETGRMSGLRSRRLDRAASPETQDAEQWFTVTAGLLRELTAGLADTPDAVVMTGNMHALLGIDAAGNPVAPAVLWSDNSAQEESDALNRRYGNGLLRLCGNRAIPVFTLPKIMRMKKEHAELYRRSAFFLQSKDFVTFRLTGQAVTDPTDASGVLAMDLDSKQWSESLLRDLAIDPAKMPPILPSASVCGKVTAAASATTGLPAGLPVITGCGDLASAAAGSGVNERTLSLTLGTAGQLLGTGAPACRDKIAGKLFVFAHADPGSDLYLGSVPAGGFSFEWFAGRHNLSMPDFFRLAESVPLSADLPIFLPYLLGRGAPSMDYRAAGAWLGLSAHHTLADLCRAAVFGALCPLRQCADLLEETAGARPELILQALACRETAVRETAAALFRQDKFLPENGEASLLGAAVTGFIALGAYPDLNAAAAAMIRRTPYAGPASDDAEELYRRFLDSAARIG